MTEYEDFVIQIQPAIQGEHRVVAQSTAGRRASLNVRVDTLRLRVERHPSSPVRHDAPASTTRDFTPERPDVRGSPHHEGEVLFETIFAGAVRDCFLQSVGAAVSKQRRLRIRLQFDVSDDSLKAVAGLPWELMYNKAQKDFLVLSSDFTVVRELLNPNRDYAPDPITGPVRVLFVMADPTETLDLDREVAEIQRAMAEFREADRRRWPGPRREVDPTYLTRATFTDFERTLAREAFHIVHFMGHGEFDASHRGQLLFQNGAVSGEQVATVLKKGQTTRLVTLNACRTGELSAAADADPFAGVASAIVLAGIPAVVAMQFPVSDTAAIAFGARLYAELERGEPIEAAVDSGRVAMLALAPQDREWATPVLFVRDVSPFSPRDFASPAVDMGMVPPSRPSSPALPAGGDTVADAWGPRTDETFRIFIGETSELQRVLRADVIRAVRASDVRVETVAPPADDAADPVSALEEHRRRVSALVRGADLCLFVLGATAGQPFDEDAPLGTFPLEQLRLAVESGRPVLLCMPAGARRSIERTEYRSLLDRLVMDIGHDANRFALKEVEKLQLPMEVASIVRDRRAAAQAATTAHSPTSLNAYVDVLKHDRLAAEKLVTLLNRHDTIGRVTHVKNDGARSPTQLLDEFARVLAEYQLYVVVQGNADASWARFRWEKAQQAAADRQVLVAVYRPAPEEGLEKFDIKLNRLPDTFARVKRALQHEIEELS